MMTIWTNIEDLLEQGFTVDQIVQFTGYKVEDVKKVASDWRKQIKQK